ncbi:MAG: single-stranded DNA-binding protein [Christensenellales bacterium]|jgi:single-strand DNA-binding protein
MNKICLVGNLTMDPELRTTGAGVSVCTFNIAVNRRFANQQGEREADFIPIVTWRSLADNCARYLAKGRKVAVTGSLQTRRYEDKQGMKRTAFEVVADDVEFLTPNKGEGGPVDRNPSAAQSGGGYYPSSGPAFDDITGFTEMDDSNLPF